MRISKRRLSKAEKREAFDSAVAIQGGVSKEKTEAAKSAFNTDDPAVGLNPTLRDLPSEPGYLYHGTSPENLESIAASGVRTHAPGYGTDQDAWPDGSVERRSYWSPRANVVWQFSPTPDCVVLRTRDGAAFRRERGTGDGYARRDVRARDLEVLTDDGWRPLAGVAEKND